MTKFQNINQIELHYYFTDDTHSLDAFIRNKCESEFLYIVKEILLTFEIDLDIETIVPQEGGLKEIWKFIGKNDKEIIAISTGMTAIVSIVALILNTQPQSMQDQELINLQKEDLKLSIREKRNKINQNQCLEKNDIDILIEHFNNNYKINRHRSKFFETINEVEKIDKIRTTKMYNDKVIEVVKTIKKSEFSKFITLENDLPLEIIDNAEIEIISPILKKGNYKWKGIYKEESIDFYMKDKIFKQSIFNGETTFGSGFNIKCILEIKNVIDDLGEIKVKSYSVSTVISEIKSNNNKRIEEQTIQGKQYLLKQKELNQPNLFNYLVKEDIATSELITGER